MTKVKNLKKKKTKKLIEQRNKSQRGFGQQSSFLDRLLGPDKMVFMGDPQCNLKDCCFTRQKEHDEESVIKGLQDENKYLKEELIEMKNKFQEQKNTLNQLGEANLDSIEKLKEYLIQKNIIKVIGEKKNLWNWDGKYLKYIEIKKSGIQQAGAVLEESSDSSIKQSEEQPKESKHELILVEEFKIKDEKLKKIIEKHTSEDSNLSLIKKQLTEIGQFIDKHLNKVSIMFYNKKKYSQEQEIYRELAKYLLHQGIKVISVNKNIAQWSEELINSIKDKFKSSDSYKLPILKLDKIYEYLSNGDDTTPDKNQRVLIQDIQPELLSLRVNLYKKEFDEDNLQQILNDLKEIQKFITKNLKEIAINFDLQTDSELKEDLKKIPNNALKDYLIEGKIIQIDNKNWKWSQEFNKIITKLTRIVKEEFLPDYSLDFLEKELLKLDDLENRSYNQKLINTIKPKLKEVIEISLSGNEKKVKQKVSSFLNKDIMNLGKQIDKDLQPIDINYHNGKKFNIPNLEDTPVSGGDLS